MDARGEPQCRRVAGAIVHIVQNIKKKAFLNLPSERLSVYLCLSGQTGVACSGFWTRVNDVPFGQNSSAAHSVLSTGVSECVGND